MEEKIVELLQTILEWAEMVEGVTVEQTPILIQEILNFYFWYHLIDLTACLFLLFVSCISAKWAYVTWPEDEHEDGPFIGRVMVFFLAGFGAIWGFLGSFNALTDLLKICVSPRVYLIEYLKDII